MASRAVTCLISGSKYTFSQEYYNKRVEEYGDVDTLQKYFITKKVKTLIGRGYDVDEIRNILGVSGDSLIPSDDSSVKDVLSYHRLHTSAATRKVSSNFATHKSDKDVAEFINNIKDINYD